MPQVDDGENNVLLFAGLVENAVGKTMKESPADGLVDHREEEWRGSDERECVGNLVEEKLTKTPAKRIIMPSAREYVGFRVRCE